SEAVQSTEPGISRFRVWSFGPSRNDDQVSESETRMSNPSSPLPDDRIPVIVGVGEITDRPRDIADGLEPLSLLEEALQRAEADSGGKLLGEIGSLDIVNFLSWRYRDPEIQLANRLGI